MDIFRIIFVFLILWGLFINDKTSQKSKLHFIFFSCVVFSVLSAIRGNSVGTDTSTYISEYYEKSIQSFEKIISNNPSCYGYYCLGKVFCNFGLDVHVWFLFIALLFNSAIFILIYRNSKNVLLSLVLYVSTGLFTFSMAGLKQTCAMGFCVYSYLIFNSRIKTFLKYLLSIILILIASMFHQSALFFIIVLFICKIKLSKKNNIIFLSLFLLIIFFGSTWLKSFIIYLANQGNRFGYYVDNVSDYTLTLFYIQLLMLIVYFIYYKNLKKENYASSVYSLSIAASFYFLTTFVSSMFRMGYYISFLNFILFPNVIENIDNVNTRKVLKYSSLLIFILYFFIFSNFKYSTIWR